MTGVLRVVKRLQMKARHHGILHRAALQQGYLQVVGVLDAQGACAHSGHGAQAAQLRHHGRSRRTALLWRQDDRGGHVAAGQQQGYCQAQRNDGQRGDADQLPAFDRHADDRAEECRWGFGM